MLADVTHINEAEARSKAKAVLRVALVPCLLRLPHWASLLHVDGWTKALQLWGGAVCGKWLLVTSAGPASCAKGQLFQHRTLLSLILLYGQIDHFYSEICCCPVNI